jgi:hypothetical protein
MVFWIILIICLWLLGLGIGVAMGLHDVWNMRRGATWTDGS